MEYPGQLFKGGEAKDIKNNGEEATARAQGFTEPYKFQEYPKHLYMGGLRVLTDPAGKESPNQERVVNGIDDEDEARAAGFLMLGDPKPEPVVVVVDPELAYLPAEVLAAVTAAGKDSIVGKALLAQYPAPATEEGAGSAKGNAKKAKSE